MEDLVQTITNLTVTYGLRLLGAIAIFIIGRWVSGVITRAIQRIMERAQVDKTLVTFVKNVVYYLLLAFVILAALNNLGVQTTSLIAILGASALAVGLALQGSLSNFAAGVLIILFRPFKVGDRVEIAGVLGFIEETQIFNTILRTPDNKTVIIPNANITSDNIVNYSSKGILRVDMVFGIGYDDDLLKAKKILEELVQADDRILANPPPRVVVKELADSSVNFAVRPFVKVADYRTVYFDLTEQVKLRFDQEGISIPFPQQDVHLFPTNGKSLVS
jgi:small conductance mechanosensitive channel